MTVFEELKWRGLINQVTHDELGPWLETEPATLYCGFDPTADSLHIGGLLPIIVLKHFQRHGHRPIAVVGGATGMIGDPSGKVDERSLLDQKQIEANQAGITAQLVRLLEWEGRNSTQVLNNAQWLASLTLVDFLRHVGKHFSVNVMIAKESVRRRLADREHGLSFTEFSYSLLQAYDFLHLFDTYGCRLQIGGSDQWGNIVAGMDLIRRLRQCETYGLTFPLLTKSDGAKFGKSEAGNVWLDAARTSPYRLYQFLINQTDADTPQLLRYMTFLSPQAVADLEHELIEKPESRSAQRRLADDVTQMVHGEEALRNAVRASQAMFGGELKGLDDATLEDVFSEVPSTSLPRAQLDCGRPLVDLLVECGVFKSKGEARRLIQSGGLYLNNERVDAEDAKLTSLALVSRNLAVVRTGKRHYHLLKFS
jgi:tyrosyl-tRNA synthetase